MAGAPPHPWPAGCSAPGAAEAPSAGPSAASWNQWARDGNPMAWDDYSTPAEKPDGMKATARPAPAPAATPGALGEEISAAFLTNLARPSTSVAPLFWLALARRRPSARRGASEVRTGASIHESSGQVGLVGKVTGKLWWIYVDTNTVVHGSPIPSKPMTFFLNLMFVLQSSDTLR